MHPVRQSAGSPAIAAEKKILVGLEGCDVIFLKTPDFIEIFDELIFQLLFTVTVNLQAAAIHGTRFRKGRHDQVPGYGG